MERERSLSAWRVLKAGKVKRREVIISKDARSDGWRVHDCQAVGVNLTILNGLGVNEGGAQRKGEKPKNRSGLDHHSNGGRDKREVIPGFSVSAICECDRVRKPAVVGCSWVARSTSDPGPCHQLIAAGQWVPIYRDNPVRPHVRTRHHHGAIHEKASLRRQHPVQKLAIIQRTACAKAICPECCCRGGGAEGHRKRFGMSTRPLICFISLTQIQPGSSRDVLFLTADEELLLVRHYLTKVVQLCGHFRFPEEVEATATTYIKRFYLTNTVMDWHPKNVMCVN